MRPEFQTVTAAPETYALEHSRILPVSEPWHFFETHNQTPLTLKAAAQQIEPLSISNAMLVDSASLTGNFSLAFQFQMQAPAVASPAQTTPNLDSHCNPQGSVALVIIALLLMAMRGRKTANAPSPGI